MKKHFLLFFIIFISSFLYAQEIEKLGEIKDIYYRDGIAGGPGSPNELSINEVDNTIKIINSTSDFTYYDLTTLEGVKKTEYRNTFGLMQIELGDFDISCHSDVLILEKDNEQIQYIAGYENIKSGISFILKKDNGYIIYYVNEDGFPSAVDTTGRIYSEEEAMAYLKKYDPEKYEQSKRTSGELELYNDFIRNRVLIWGKTHYMKHNVMVQYDLQGNYYFMQDFGSLGSDIGCYFNDKCIFYKFTEGLNPYSEIIKNCKDDDYYSSSWYLGFGGNIYYYVTGKEYTEVFRIRRTWGDPDFYAMAINGYTDDSYGKYVNKVLPTLSKSDLRLLRNTIFALYGVHFKSADLSKYFDKQVWYTDEGKTSADVTLPEHRQKLVEMIQKLEK